MGVLAHRLHTLDRSLVPPYRHERKFSGACVSRVTFKHLPQAFRSHILSFGTLGQLFEIPPFPPKNRIVRGVGGVPEFFFWLESSYA
jgi:hypothetical protein